MTRSACSLRSQSRPWIHWSSVSTMPRNTPSSIVSLSLPGVAMCTSTMTRRSETGRGGRRVGSGFFLGGGADAAS